VHKQTAGPKPLLLVVDDDVTMRTFLMAVLQKSGYRILAAESGDEAVRIIEATADIDLLLTDVVMPGSLNGFALARRALEIRPTLKVVCISGYTRGAEFVEDLPPVPLLQKPLHPNMLRSQIAATLHLAS
jgi:CheY-like chemotaxis protein